MKLQESGVDFYGAPEQVAINKGYRGTFSFPALRDQAKTYYNSVN